MSDDNTDDEEVDILEHATHGRKVPHAKSYRVPIDGKKVKVKTPTPTGEELLKLVDKRPCAYELIEEFVHHKNDVVEPNETVDLRREGLKGFITAHKEIVTIFIDGPGYPIERGKRTVAEILSKVGKNPEGYILLEEKNGPPLPLDENKPVEIVGCEIFHTQVQTGGSS